MVESRAPLLSIEDLKVHFPVGGRRIGRWEPPVVHAVDGVSLRGQARARPWA